MPVTESLLQNQLQTCLTLAKPLYYSCKTSCITLAKPLYYSCKTSCITLAKPLYYSCKTSCITLAKPLYYSCKTSCITLAKPLYYSCKTSCITLAKPASNLFHSCNTNFEPEMCRHIHSYLLIDLYEVYRQRLHSLRFLMILLHVMAC